MSHMFPPLLPKEGLVSPVVSFRVTGFFCTDR